MADVYLAAADGIGGFTKLQVIKRLRNLEEPEAVTMFLDEARLAARLSHPNVVQTFEIGEEQGHYFMAMEYLEGPSLARFRRRGADGLISVRLALSLVSSILDGLEYAHSLKDLEGNPLNVVHRDLSPHNVIITLNGDVKILDFGIAKASDITSVTRAGYFKGKLAYMPPEQARAEPIDRRVDLFSVAIILVELLTGRSFWANTSDMVILTRLVANDIPKPTLIDDLPPGVEEAVSMGLAAHQANRFSTAQEFKQAIDFSLGLAGGPVTRDEIAQRVKSLFGPELAETRLLADSQLRRSTADAPTSINHHSGLLPEVKRAATPSAQSAPGTFVPQTGAIQSPITGTQSGWSLVLAPAIAAGVAAALVALGVAGFWVGRTSSTDASQARPTAPSIPAAVAIPVVPPPSVPSVPSIPLAPRPASVQVRINTSPADAKLKLDGKNVGTGFFSGQFPQDEQSHRLVVEAPGHLPHVGTLVFDQDLTLEVSLKKARAGNTRSGANRSRAVPLASPVSPKPDAAPKTPDEDPYAIKKRPLDADVFERDSKSLDQEDPWKK